MIEAGISPTVRHFRKKARIEELQSFVSFHHDLIQRTGLELGGALGLISYRLTYAGSNANCEPTERRCQRRYHLFPNFRMDSASETVDVPTEPSQVGSLNSPLSNCSDMS